MTTDNPIAFNYGSVLFDIRDDGVYLTLRSWTDGFVCPSDSCPAIEIRSILDARTLDAMVAGLASLLRYQVPSPASWEHPLMHVRARTLRLPKKPSRKQTIARKEQAKQVRARGPDELEIVVDFHGSTSRFILWNDDAHALLVWLAPHAGWELSGLDDDQREYLEATLGIRSAA